MKILQTTTATVVPKTGLALSDGQKIGKQVLKRYWGSGRQHLGDSTLTLARTLTAGWPSDGYQFVYASPHPKLMGNMRSNPYDIVRRINKKTMHKTLYINVCFV